MKRLQTILLTLFVMSTLQPLSAQQVSTHPDKLANQGYDLVNYFTAHSAERGSKEFSTEHAGATYYFSNAANLAAFTSAPEKYLPQFDGYCAFAVAKMNKKVPADPKTFRIDDGNLYLFYNDFWEGKPFNTLVPWLNHEADMEKLARANWETLQGGK